MKWSHGFIIGTEYLGSSLCTVSVSIHTHAVEFLVQRSGGGAKYNLEWRV